MKASDFDFYEMILGPDGKPHKKGFHYVWGVCKACGEVRLALRAGLGARRCIMTPGCKGHLEAASYDEIPVAAQAVGMAIAAFDASVLAVIDTEEPAL